MEYPRLRDANEVRQVLMTLEKGVHTTWDLKGITAQDHLRSWSRLIRTRFDTDNLPLTARCDEFPVLQPLIDRLTQMESKVDVVTSVCARMETCMHTQNDLMLKQLEMLQTLSSENAEMRSQIILMRTLPSTDPTLKDHVLPPPPPPAPVTGGGGGGGHGDTTLVSTSTLSEGFRGGGGGTD